MELGDASGENIEAEGGKYGEAAGEEVAEKEGGMDGEAGWWFKKPPAAAVAARAIPDESVASAASIRCTDDCTFDPGDGIDPFPRGGGPVSLGLASLDKPP